MDKKSILFVDDEIRILDAFKRTFRKYNKQWDMYFALSGNEALSLMETRKNKNLSPINIIISDMKMPGMNGSELLKIISEKYPNTIRFILSGQAEEKEFINSFSYIHQYFSKPLESEQLINSVTRIFNIRKYINNQEINDLIIQIKNLPVLPSIYTKIDNLLKTDNYSIKSLSEIINQDISLTAKILQLANSSYFSISKRISDLQQAISVIGIEYLKNLIIIINLFTQVDNEITFNFNIKKLWDHSLRTANIAKLLAKELNLNPIDIDNCYTSALLHDIGKLILAASFPTMYLDIYNKYQNEKDTHSLEAYEYQNFKVSHAEIGAYLISLWGFNDNIIEPILFHHNMSQLSDIKVDNNFIVYIANCIDHEIQSLDQTMLKKRNYSLKLNNEYFKTIEKEMEKKLKKEIKKYDKKVLFKENLINYFKDIIENDRINQNK
ncbi:MAG: response regulator [Candidatus Cloacimonetes bacterium]|nr:response regulator [Candidatus Cloacimonadota bacterium]